MASDTLADLTPHPLILRVASGLHALDVPLADSAKRLLDKELGAHVDARAAFAAVTAEDQQRPPGEEPLTGVRQAQDDDADGASLAAAKAYVALALAGASNVPRVVTFAGYVGGRFTREDREWCVFYLDTRLMTWILVESDGIVFRDRLEVADAPCGQRDVIWVKADAAVGLGNAEEAAQSQFLTGEFTSAGDIEAPMGAGTLGAATGVFCEAGTVGCCKNNTKSLYCGKP
jgi:hypothetical protein